MRARPFVSGFVAGAGLTILVGVISLKRSGALANVAGADYSMALLPLIVAGAVVGTVLGGIAMLIARSRR